MGQNGEVTAGVVAVIISVLTAIGSLYAVLRQQRREDLVVAARVDATQREAAARLETERTETERADDETALRQYSQLVKDIRKEHADQIARLRTEHRAEMGRLEDRLGKTEESLRDTYNRETICREAVAQLRERVSHLERGTSGDGSTDHNAAR